VKFSFIEAQKDEFPVNAMCRVLEVPKSGYYAWLQSRDLPDRRFKDDDDDLRREIVRIHRNSNGVYGRPRIHASLRARGWKVGAKRVRRILVEEGLRGRGRRSCRRAAIMEAQQPSENLLKRNFDAEKPNRVWLGDITCIEVGGVFWYLAAVLDVFSRRMVGWHLADHADTGIVVKALRNALDRRRPGRDELVFHSDQGVQYRSDRFRRILNVYGIAQSMSRRGNCWDNAPMESFFASLKLECTDRRTWSSPEELLTAVRDYIAFYNTRRLHSALAHQAPRDYENAA
jgi:putative transposase